MNRKYIVLDDNRDCDNCGKMLNEGDEVLVASSQFYFCDSECFEMWEENRMEVEDEL